MPRVVLLALISVSLLVAGCGAGTSAGGDDPASAVPVKAAFYVDATVRPEGDLREDALAAAGKVLRTSDPQAKIDELVKQAFAETEDPKFDYEKDVAPWLGEKVAVWGSASSGEEDFRGAVVVSTKDEDEAQSAIDRAAEASDKTFSEREYKGVEYKASPESAVGIVEGFAVAGTEPEFKQTVDAAKGDGLASDDRFKKAMDGLEDDRLGAFYVDFQSRARRGGPPETPRPRSSSTRSSGCSRSTRSGRSRARSWPTATGWRSTRPRRSRRARSRPGSARSTRAARRRCWPSCRATRGSPSARRTSARR